MKIIKNPREVFFLGFFFRLLLLFSFPALSDDFYRFVWDGQLFINGINPYTVLPSEFIHLPEYQQVIHNSTIYQHLNSPNYYTVYPPLNQFIFGISAWLSQGSLFANVVWLRVFILVAETSTLFLMQKSFNQLNQNFALYTLNPLIIIELTGNLHFESVVIFFLLASLYFLSNNYSLKNILLSAFFFACAVSTKMLPLIFIPLIIRHLYFENKPSESLRLFLIPRWQLQTANGISGLLYVLLVGILTLLFFVPFLDKMLIEKIFSSINLYFQKFEFNASIYYLVREIGFKITGYNIIGTAGKVLAFLTFSGIIFISWRSNNFFTGALSVLFLYFTMATTIHPWYVSTLVAISIFTKFRFPIVWSYLIFLSYATYQTTLYQENLWLVFIEYLLVFVVIIYELKKVPLVYSP